MARVARSAPSMLVGSQQKRMASEQARPQQLVCYRASMILFSRTLTDGAVYDFSL